MFHKLYLFVLKATSTKLLSAKKRAFLALPHNRWGRPSSGLLVTDRTEVYDNSHSARQEIEHSMGVRVIILAHGGRAVVSPYPPVRRVVRVKKL